MDPCQKTQMLLVVRVDLFRFWSAIFFLQVAAIKIGNGAQPHPEHHFAELFGVFRPGFPGGIGKGQRFHVSLGQVLPAIG